MTNITMSRIKYVFEHYDPVPVKLEPHRDGYGKRLFKDHHHKTPIKFNIPDNVSDSIYGKP